MRDTLFRGLGYSPIQTLFLCLPWPAMMAISAAQARVAAGWRVSILALAGLALAGIGGVWDVAMDTLVSWQRRDKVSKLRGISRAGVGRYALGDKDRGSAWSLQANALTNSGRSRFAPFSGLAAT